MKKIKLEIIIANSYLEALVHRLEECGVRGYTAVEISRGKGLNHGEHLSEGLLPVTRNTLVFSITTEDTCDKIAKEMGEFLSERSAIVICSEVSKVFGLSQ